VICSSTMINWVYPCFLLLSFSGLLGCSPNSDNTSKEPPRPQYVGDLDRKAQEIYSRENERFFYSCDHEQRKQILEVARSLEVNRTKIESMYEKFRSNGNKYKTVLINNIPFLEPVSNTSEADDEWYEVFTSWKKVFRTYQEIKDNLEDERWLDINIDARSLIVEDEDRILRGTHPWVRRELKEIIETSANSLKKCLADPNCISPNLTAREREWLDRSPHIEQALSEPLNSEYSFDQRREWISIIYDIVAEAIDKTSGEVNFSISKENNQLIVPIDLSTFGDESSRVASFLEEVWSSDHLRIQVRDIQRDDVYKVVVSHAVGERAYVSRAKMKMHLYAPIRFTTLAHEFGHVLGLPDEYFTSFDSSTCTYIDQVNDKNIMSSAARGKVTSENVHSIKTLYGID